ncbi:MAG: DNA polymerase Y family protein [Acidobacteria bacterium]|nr:DNA polymerase Y family protein [Acidobacteriota bacterium]
MLFACLFVPDFPVAAVVRAEPELRAQAIAVVAGVPPQLTVAAANARARAAGVEAGMTELEAKAHSPSLAIRRRSPQLELATQVALAELAQSVSPHIECTAPGTVLLDLAGLDRLLGPPAKLARDLTQRVAALGLEANVGVAANPDAALHAARGFAGIALIPAGREAERLGNLPLNVLAPAPEILETLDLWGVRTFRALAALPEVAVAERLGEEGLRLQKLARGAGSRVLQCAGEELHFEEKLELEAPIEDLEPLAFVLGRLLDQICACLKARALAVQELRVKLDLDSPRRHGDAEVDQVSGVGYQVSGVENRTSDTRHLIPGVHERTLRLPVPLADARVFLKLLQLELAAHPPPAPVMRVTLTAEPAKPRVEQSGLFLPKAPQPEKLELVLARLAAAGAGSAGSPQLLDTHRPSAFRMTRFNPIAGLPNRRIAELKDSPGAARHNSAIPQFGNPTILALRLFRPPLAAFVQLRDGRPLHVACAAIRGAVVWLAGPWRSSGDWWQQVESASHPSDAASGSASELSASAVPWAREEWDVALKQNEAGLALYRIFRDLIGGKWFVEGEYD